MRYPRERERKRGAEARGDDVVAGAGAIVAESLVCSQAQ